MLDSNLGDVILNKYGDAKNLILSIYFNFLFISFLKVNHTSIYFSIFLNTDINIQAIWIIKSIFKNIFCFYVINWKKNLKRKSII
jgi:hypothetical protein